MKKCKSVKKNNLPTVYYFRNWNEDFCKWSQKFNCFRLFLMEISDTMISFDIKIILLVGLTTKCWFDCWSYKSFDIKTILLMSLTTKCSFDCRLYIQKEQHWFAKQWNYWKKVGNLPLLQYYHTWCFVVTVSPWRKLWNHSVTWKLNFVSNLFKYLNFLLINPEAKRSPRSHSAEFLKTCFVSCGRLANSMRHDSWVFED